LYIFVIGLLKRSVPEKLKFMIQKYSYVGDLWLFPEERCWPAWPWPEPVQPGPGPGLAPVLEPGREPEKEKVYSISPA